METMTEATQRLRAGGYTQDVEATDDGELRCPACGSSHDPGSVEIDEQVRFEGETDPADEALLLAISCGCGARGLYATAFGPNIGREDAEVVRRLPRHTG